MPVKSKAQAGLMGAVLAGKSNALPKSVAREFLSGAKTKNLPGHVHGVKAHRMYDGGEVPSDSDKKTVGDVNKNEAIKFGKALGSYDEPQASPQPKSKQTYAGSDSGYARGGVIPGKAKYRGNNPKNDTVSLKGTPGEIVLPLSVTKSKNPGERAKQFVNGIKSHRRHS